MQFKRLNACVAATLVAFTMNTTHAANDDIVDTAVKAGSFKTLAAALNAADLVDALKGNGPFTVFAPTDEAFAKLPSGTLESLLKPENKDKLTAILKYHVVPGRVLAADALAAGSAKTLEGSPVRIRVEGDSPMVNGAKLVSTDIAASNGVIHVVDSVLLPSENSQSEVHPRQMIETAIRTGAPLYNQGHVSQCASVYMSTVQTLLSSEGHSMCSSTRHSLETALTSAQHSTCSDSQAWTLRHALDNAYNSMALAR